MNEQRITFTGNLTADPELRFTPSGRAVANFTVAATPRRYDRATGEWKDGDAVFLRCNVWQAQAEQVAESLKRGHRVIVTGSLRQRTWATRDTGEERTTIELDVDDVAASLKFAFVTVKRVERQTPANDAPAATGQFDDEPPF